MQMSPVSDKMIKTMAKSYIRTPNASIRSVAEKYNIGASTLHGYFAVRLKNISPTLFEKVNKKKAANIERVHKNLKNNTPIKKRHFLSFLFK